MRMLLTLEQQVFLLEVWRVIRNSLWRCLPGMPCLRDLLEKRQRRPSLQVNEKSAKLPNYLFKVVLWFPLMWKVYMARKIGFATYLIFVKGMDRSANNFNCTFDARQRRVKYVWLLTKTLTRVKGKVKCADKCAVNLWPTSKPKSNMQQLCHTFDRCQRRGQKKSLKLWLHIWRPSKARSKNLTALTSHLMLFKVGDKYAAALHLQICSSFATMHLLITLTALLTHVKDESNMCELWLNLWRASKVKSNVLITLT